MGKKLQLQCKRLFWQWKIYHLDQKKKKKLAYDITSLLLVGKRDFFVQDPINIIHYITLYYILSVQCKSFVLKREDIQYGLERGVEEKNAYKFIISRPARCFFIGSCKQNTYFQMTESIDNVYIEAYYWCVVRMIVYCWRDQNNPRIIHIYVAWRSGQMDINSRAVGDSITMAIKGLIRIFQTLLMKSNYEHSFFTGELRQTLVSRRACAGQR